MGTTALTWGHWLAVAFSLGLAAMAFFLVANEAKRTKRPLRYVRQVGYGFASASLAAIVICAVRLLQSLRH
jgi:hypothetical protein